MFDHLLESSHRDDSNKWSNIGFGQEITVLASIEVNLMHLIRSSVNVTFHSIDLKGCNKTISFARLEQYLYKICSGDTLNIQQEKVEKILSSECKLLENNALNSVCIHYYYNSVCDQNSSSETVCCSL